VLDAAATVPGAPGEERAPAAETDLPVADPQPATPQSGGLLSRLFRRG
jgi:hypothetical protein